MVIYHESGTICNASKVPCPLGASNHIEASDQRDFEAKLSEKYEQETKSKSSVREDLKKDAEKEAVELKKDLLLSAFNPAHPRFKKRGTDLMHYRQFKRFAEAVKSNSFPMVISNTLKTRDTIHPKIAKGLVSLASNMELNETIKERELLLGNKAIGDLENRMKKQNENFARTGDPTSLEDIDFNRNLVKEWKSTLAMIKSSSTKKELVAKVLKEEITDSSFNALDSFL